MTAEEKKAACREYNHKYYEAHREQIRGQQRLYKNTHTEQVREYARKWAVGHPESRRQYREEHPEQKLAADRRYRETHREQAKERQTRWRKAHREQDNMVTTKRNRMNPQRGRDQIRKYRHGVTSEEYAQRLAEQGEVCAICGGNRSKNALAVDHDHATGKICGLLCLQCNAGLGCFADNSEWMRKAIEYNDRTRGGNKCY